MDWRSLLSSKNKKNGFDHKIQSLRENFNTITGYLDELGFTEEGKKFKQKSDQLIEKVIEFHSFAKKDEQDVQQMEAMQLDKLIEMYKNTESILNTAYDFKRDKVDEKLFTSAKDGATQATVFALKFLDDAIAGYDKLISDRKQGNRHAKNGVNYFVEVQPKFLEKINYVKEILENKGFNEQATSIDEAAKKMLNAMTSRENHNKKDNSAKSLCLLTVILINNTIPALKEMDNNDNKDILVKSHTQALCQLFTEHTPKKQFSVNM